MIWGNCNNNFFFLLLTHGNILSERENDTAMGNLAALWAVVTQKGGF
jgi:hypothetical protein